MSGRANYDDRLANYIEVKERIRLFYEQHPDGRLVTTDVRMTSEPDGVPRVLVHARAYRTPDDPLPADGWSWMVLPGSTPYTRGSELENTETSAWGRAIGALNIGISGGIASAQEVRNKEGEEQRETKQSGTETLELLGRIQKSGKVEKGGSDSYKGDYRETPGGHVIGFRLNIDGEDRAIPQVLLSGGIGEALYAAQLALLGERVTVKGHLYNVKSPGRSAYYRLIAGDRPEDFIETADLRIPPLPDPEQDAVDAIPEGQTEAFDAAESAAIDEAEAAKA